MVKSIADEELHQDIGRLKEAVETLKDDVKETRSDVAQVKLMLADMKGGRRMLIAMVTASATLGAAVTELVRWLHTAIS